MALCVCVYVVHIYIIHINIYIYIEIERERERCLLLGSPGGGHSALEGFGFMEFSQGHLLPGDEPALTCPLSVPCFS